MWIDAKAMAENCGAENVVQPVDTRYLNDSLHSFLTTFALHFSDDTYDCENITEDSNILHGVIGESECVDYGLYSEELAVENSYDTQPLLILKNCNIRYAVTAIISFS